MKKKLLVINLLLVAGSSEKKVKKIRKTEGNLSLYWFIFKCLAKKTNSYTHAERNTKQKKTVARRDIDYYYLKNI